VLPTNIDVPNPNAPHPQKPDKLPADMPAGTVFPFAGSVLAHGLRDASIPGTADYDIKAWIAYGTNLLMGLPNPERTREALRNLDFVVAIDVLPAEICGWADVVLPESTYLERYDDLQSPPYREPFVALRQPVVPPIHDTKPGWWMAKELAKRWGREAELFPWDDPRAYLKARVDAMGRSFEELERKGVLTDPKPPLTIEDGVEPTFGTPSGKIELFSQQLADAGHAPLPEYEPVEQPGPGEFRLLFGRAPTHTFGRTANNRFLASVYAENELWVPAGIAKERGLQMGEEVVLVGRDGTKTLPIKVRVTQRIRPDCVYMTHGFGHTAQGLRFAKGKGADDNQVAGSEVDPIMGGTGMNATFVKVEAV
jgi:thiosulfate reductase/polysulfide reductase chain A